MNHFNIFSLFLFQKLVMDFENWICFELIQGWIPFTSWYYWSRI